MKKIILLFCITLNITKAQTYYMCINSSASSNSGNIYDSGGSSGNYSSSENCGFLISPTNGGAVTLYFTSFNTEAGYDYLRVYNGTSSSAPLIGTYAGSSLPTSIVASSGKMYLAWSSDGSYNYSGWAANWTSVSAVPVANFNVYPDVCTGAITLNNTTTGTVTSWLWNFGDGTTSTLKTPSHTYSVAGTYYIDLKATNSNGNNSLTKVTSVNPQLVQMGFNGTPMLDIPVNFTVNYNQGSIYTWDFGNGNTSNIVNPNFTFNNVGVYNVSLTVSGNGCDITNVLAVNINDGVSVAELKAQTPISLNVVPNPFIGSTSIQLEVLNNQSIELNVINSLGQIVKTIKAENLEGGTHQFEINSLDAGIYYIQNSKANNLHFKVVSLK